MPKNKRANSKEMEERINRALDLLDCLGEICIDDLRDKYGFTYPQALTVLTTLQGDCAIERLPGRRNKKIYYIKSDGNRKETATFLMELIDRNQTSVKVVEVLGEHYISYVDMLEVAKTTPEEVVYAEIVNLYNETYVEGVL